MAPHFLAILQISLTGKIVPKTLEKHGDKRIDNYYWLNERENPEVIDYLNKENEYYQKATAHTKQFQEDLFLEMKSRIKEDDTSVPYFYNGYYYITRFEKGKDYPIYARKKGSLDAPEEIIFDCNEMAKDHTYFRLVGLNINLNNDLVSYGIDTTGRRQYTLHIKDLKTNKIFNLVHNEDGWENQVSSIHKETLTMGKGFKADSIKMKTSTLQKLLPYNCVIDILMVDVEGHEIQVLESLNWGLNSPRIILIENNGEFYNRKKHCHTGNLKLLHDFLI